MEWCFVSETQHLWCTSEIKSTPPSQCYIKCIYTFCNNNLCNYIMDFLGNCHQRVESVFGWLRPYDSSQKCNFYSITKQYWYCANYTPKACILFITQRDANFVFDQKWIMGSVDRHEPCSNSIDYFVICIE